jgi:hypothetical protein
MCNPKRPLESIGPIFMFFILIGSTRATILTTPGFGGGQGHKGYMVMPEPYVDANHQVQIPIENQGPAGYVPWLYPEKPGDYFTNKWSVLNDKAYGRDWGWFDSRSNLGPDQTWWIKLESHTDGLVTYNGAANLIFQNDGDWWNFQGGMLHNVYAIPTPAQPLNAFATYKVYVGDSSRTIDTTITPGTITFIWQVVVPEPFSLILWGLGGVLYGWSRGRKS